MREVAGCRRPQLLRVVAKMLNPFFKSGRNYSGFFFSEFLCINHHVTFIIRRKLFHLGEIEKGWGKQSVCALVGGSACRRQGLPSGTLGDAAAAALESAVASVSEHRQSLPLGGHGCSLTWTSLFPETRSDLCTSLSPPIEEPGGKGTGPGCLVSARSSAFRARCPEARAGPVWLAG